MGRQFVRSVYENSTVSKKIVSLNLYPVDHPNSLDHPDNKVFKGIIEDFGEVFEEIDRFTSSVQETAKELLPTVAFNALSNILGILFQPAAPVDFKAEAEKVAKKEKALESKFSGITDQRTSVQIGIASVSQALGAPLMTVLTRVANALGLDKTEVGQVLGSTVSAATNSIAMSTPAGMLLMLGSGMVAAGLGSVAESLGESRVGILAGDIIKAIPTLAMQAMNAPKDEMSARAEQMAPILDRVVSNFSDATVAVTEVAKNLLISTSQIISNHTTELAFLAIAAAAKVKGGKNANLIATTALTLAACHAAGKVLGAEGAPVRRDLSANIIPSWYSYVSGTLNSAHFYGKDEINKTEPGSLQALARGGGSIFTSSLDPGLRFLLGINDVTENSVLRTYDDLVILVREHATNFVDGSGTPNVIDSIAIRIAAQAIVVAKTLRYTGFIPNPIIVGDACSADSANTLLPATGDVFNLCVGIEPEFGLPVVANACGFTRADLQDQDGRMAALGAANSFVSSNSANPVCAPLLPTTTAVPTPGTSTSVKISSSTTMLLTTSTTTPPTTTVEITTTTSTGTTTSETVTLPQTTTEIVTGTPGVGTPAASSRASNIGLTAGLAVAGLALTVGGVILYLKRGGESLAQRVVRAAESVDTIPMKHIVTHPVLEAFNGVLDDRANEED